MLKIFQQPARPVGPPEIYRPTERQIRGPDAGSFPGSTGKSGTGSRRGQTKVNAIAPDIA